MENIKASLAHRRGDQAVFEGRHHTAVVAGRHGSLRVRVVWGAECLQLPIKSMHMDSIWLKRRACVWLIRLQV